MNAAVESPQGVETWVEYLKDKPLSVRNSIQMKLRKKLRSDSTTLADISKLVRLDPVLALAIVRKAAALHHEKGSEVTGLDHAVHSLGMDLISGALATVPPLKLNPTSVAQKMYFRAIANSHHAATQAYYLSHKRNAMFAEETYLASLFYGVAHWALWLHAPLHMSRIQVKIREDGIDTVLAETDVLGCTLQDLSKGLIEAWQLSSLAEESLDHSKSPSREQLQNLNLRATDDMRLSAEEVRETNHLVQQKFFPVKIANWLALTAPLGWNHPKTMRVVEVFNDFLKGDIDDTASDLHQNCATSSRQYHVPGTLTPAAEMLMLPSTLHAPYKLPPREEALYLKTAIEPIKPRVSSPPEPVKTAAKAATKTAPAPAKEPERPPAAFADQNIYAQIAQRFLKGFSGYTEPRQILQALLQALHRGLGMKRVVFYRIQPKTMHMQAGSTLGMDPDFPMEDLSFELNVPSLFKRLAEKSSCIWITQVSRPEMLRMMPDATHPLVPEDGAMMMSIFLDSKPVGIIHVDSPSNDANLVSFHHERFRYLCSAATLALKRITGKG